MRRATAAGACLRPGKSRDPYTADATPRAGAKIDLDLAAPRRTPWVLRPTSSRAYRSCYVDSNSSHDVEESAERIILLINLPQSPRPERPRHKQRERGGWLLRAELQMPGRHISLAVLAAISPGQRLVGNLSRSFERPGAFRG